MKNLLASFMMLSLAATNAVAGGHYYNQCGQTYTQHYQAQTYQAPVYQAPQVFLVKPQYDEPLVGRGTFQPRSNGGEQSYQLRAEHFLNPNDLFSTEQQALKTASQAFSQRYERYDKLLDKQLDGQRDALNIIAKAEAASKFARTITDGLNGQGGDGDDLDGMVIQRDKRGNLTLTRLNKIKQKLAGGQGGLSHKSYERYQSTETSGSNGPGPGPSEEMPDVMHFCGQCHAPDLAKPAGGLRLGPVVSLAPDMDAAFLTIKRMLRSGKMPPPDAVNGQPTKEQGVAILDQIEAFVDAQSGKE